MVKVSVVEVEVSDMDHGVVATRDGIVFPRRRGRSADPVPGFGERLSPPSQCSAPTPVEHVVNLMQSWEFFFL